MKVLFPFLGFIFIFIASWFIYEWHTNVEYLYIQYRKPGLDNTDDRYSYIEDVIVGKHFESFGILSSKSELLSGKWTRFRGKYFDNIIDDNISLLSNLSNDLNEIMWSVSLGEGYAAPVIYEGKVYLIDYLEDINADALRCFDLLTGKELWRRWYNVSIARNHGKSRTVPAVNENYVLTIGPKGHVMCVDRITGDLIWTKDMVKDYGTFIPQWYTGQCPVIDNNIAVLAPAGDTVLMTGIFLNSGETAWETYNKHNISMSHSSIIKMNIHNNDMYVYVSADGIVGVSAEEHNVGELLWYNNEWRSSIIAPSPVYIGNGNIFVTAGYGAGSAVFNITNENNGWKVELTKSWRPFQGIASEQQTPIFYNDILFTVLPNDAGINRQQLAAALPHNNFEISFLSGRELRFGLGPFIIADEKIFALNDVGKLYIMNWENDRINLLDKKRVLDGVDSWGPIALADGYLLVRDTLKMICINLNENSHH